MTSAPARILSALATTLLAAPLVGAVPASAVAASSPESSMAAAPRGDVSQWRSYWVDAFNEGIYTTAQVRRLVSDAKAAGANVLMVQVARRFDCFCNASTFPRAEASGLARAPYDPLTEVVAQGHAAGLQVHAWVNATTLWHSATPPRSAAHAFNRHGFRARGAERWLNRRVDGVERIGNSTYLDPGNPAAVEYLVEGIASLQRRYAIDGVNLDYIRYPDDSARGTQNDWGYTPVALARFRAETGRRGTPAPADPQWSQWRRDQVTNLVRKVHVRMLAQDRGDRLSVNGVVYGSGPAARSGWTRTAPYQNVLQDWRGWMAEGVVDTVAAMNYKRANVPAQARMFSSWNAALAAAQKETGRAAVSGTALYLNTIPASIAQAAEVARAGIGWSGYAYSEVSTAARARPTLAVRNRERVGFAARLRSVFPSAAAVPDMPWKRHTGAVSGRVVWGRTPLDQVDVTIHGPRGYASRTRSDGSGWFGAVALPPGQYTVSVTGRNQASTTRPVLVSPGRVTSVALGATRR